MSDSQTVDPKLYRQVLGQYPTGVCVITAIGEDGVPIAMVVGSFTSVSLSPPLVGFFPDKASSSWAKLRSSSHFCVNMLAATQEHVCRKLASKDPDKFSGTAHSLSDKGIPLLHDVVARIECDMHDITDAGDHELALGLVRSLEIVSDAPPLLFCQGGYGSFLQASPHAQQGVKCIG
ncbi:MULTISPECIES: flavin reductase family protein [Sphingobium]|uniref:flavin reductase family protein n=1 Tax=Sphingobium TaxID=165695 RepID=UPI00159C9BD7|nr:MULTISPECIES: flavin reductase family protein [unclassified Sphingobium]